MLTPIVISDFSFIPARKHITIYFKEHPVYEFDATYQVTKEAKETIAAIVHGYNTQTRYEIPGRKIREIMENRQFPLVYHDFNSYVADWPEAEASRAWDTNSGKRPAKLMQAQGHGNSMPGGYYWLSVVEYRTSRNAPLAYGVRIHDCDDGSCSKDATSQLEADAQLEEVLKLAPSSMREICALAGFYWD